MKNNKIQIFYLIIISFVAVSFLASCENAKALNINENTSVNEDSDLSKSQRTVSQETKDYWYDGKAELSSYKLSQARYGELHEGTAVLVYVTEPFSPSSNTKADFDRKDNIPALKLNKTKKFTTGIYPYSMMNSTFFPFENGNHSMKISSSLQEWCGMTYLEMKNKSSFNFTLDSYFEGTSLENKKVKKSILEDDLWSLIRLNPELLPVGENSIIPSMFFLRLRHKEIKTYKSIAKVYEEEGVKFYEIKYPELDREIKIKFEKEFPYKVLGWQETNYSGYGEGKKLLTSTAELIETVKTDYWNQNLNEHKEWRSKLGLK